jgi:hypothetical protein
LNQDNRISRDEWQGARANFDMLDDNRDGVLTRPEVFGTEPPPDRFSRVDAKSQRDDRPRRVAWAAGQLRSSG